MLRLASPPANTHQEWRVAKLCYEVDSEPYARSRDAAVRELAAAAGVAVSAHVSHTLYVSAWPRAACVRCS